MADIFRPQTDPSEDPPRTSLKALLPLIPYALRYKGQIFGALAALTVASVATLTVPVAVKGMIDHGFSGDGGALIGGYFLAMLAVVAVLAVASGLRYFFVMIVGERVVADLRRDVFAHLARLDASFFDGARTGELLSRLTADTTQMKAAFGASASVALRNLFMFAGAVAMMVYTSPKLSGLVLVAIPIIVFPLVASGRGVRRRARRAQDTLAEASAFAAENLGAVRTMQAFNAQGGTLRRFAQAVEDAYGAARDTTAARALLTVVAIFLAFSSVIAVLWLGAQDVLAGRMSAGQLSQFVLYAVFGASSLGQLSEVWSEISQAAGAAGRLAEILAIQPKIVAPVPSLALPQPAQGRIAFEDVHFAYPSRPDAQALKGLTFSIAPGETVALVGPSGAGKSTVFQLLLRFYDPQSGVVRVDGIDVAKADPDAVRARIALVPQEPVIFSGTIADNIRYGREDAPQEAIVDAARRAAADEFIRVMPQGYQARVGERGVTLSGGQKQRLAIARAILRDAPVLLLDEATSALDAENERLVQAALENIMGSRTTIVIAHRLATVLKADRILVMEDGRIVEEGSHAALVARGGLYARLARLQFNQPDVRAAE
ncbi:ABC transporter transmembrane domain-containing protein [Methylocella sp. CPCC 101449]|uniref:ABC transporter transmembrane domain-containing protein n=1 Tax=Methylocella sp. CPCC 101449 TaxID=2987531 RepID=UPI0028918696|nr:ABC transporter transmembrane domain-containing protein [Methylocella sp. CPCC 101449]MDT2023565.1 ABC transporter transmembrane domain-containing protein [Methylocella sp. CPCC 101449]HEV2573898.1 ABC transporter transmembrane domain-containing protein [Beijerinckiaceae bacterium]